MLGIPDIVLSKGTIARFIGNFRNKNIKFIVLEAVESTADKMQLQDAYGQKGEFVVFQKKIFRIPERIAKKLL